MTTSSVLHAPNFSLRHTLESGQFFRYTGSYLGFEDMLTFRYRNDTVYPSGTYTGQVRFTIAQL